MVTKPDLIWQFAKHLKKEYSKKGKDIAVYVDGHISVNGNSYVPLIDKTIDLTSVKWSFIKHNEWLLPSSKE
jgi:hypothetical protein